MQFGLTRATQVQPVISNTIYAANDVVGGLITFPIQGTSGEIKRVLIVDDDNEKTQLNLYLFREQPATINDNAAFSLTAADLKKAIAKIPIAGADYETIGADALAIVEQSRKFDAPSGTLWGYLVCVATPTYAATSDLTITLVIAHDRN